MFDLTIHFEALSIFFSYRNCQQKKRCKCQQCDEVVPFAEFTGQFVHRVTETDHAQQAPQRSPEKRRDARPVQKVPPNAQTSDKQTPERHDADSTGEMTHLLFF